MLKFCYFPPAFFCFALPTTNYSSAPAFFLSGISKTYAGFMSAVGPELGAFAHLRRVSNCPVLHVEALLYLLFSPAPIWSKQKVLCIASNVFAWNAKQNKSASPSESQCGRRNLGVLLLHCTCVCRGLVHHDVTLN